MAKKIINYSNCNIFRVKAILQSDNYGPTQDPIRCLKIISIVQKVKKYEDFDHNLSKSYIRGATSITQENKTSNDVSENEKKNKDKILTDRLNGKRLI